MTGGPARTRPNAADPAGAVDDHGFPMRPPPLLADDPPTAVELSTARAAVAVLAVSTWGTRPSDWLELRRAARLVVAEWGDGDDVDPDRMDVVVERLADALPALEDAAGDG